MKETPKLPKRKHLQLWFAFAKLVPASYWRADSNARLRVRPRESFDAWFERNRVDFELIPNFGLIEHNSVEDFKSHFIEGFYEAHVSVNLYAPVEMIRREFESLLKKKHKRRGIPDAAGFRLNGDMDAATEEALGRVLKVLKAPKGLTNDEVAASCLGGHFKDAKSARSAVSQARARGEAILRAIPQGIFPFPDGAAQDWSGKKAEVRMTKHRLLDE
jgi:hypothetical protein